jgi:putative addiction module component (TIGR02574 family)
MSDPLRHLESEASKLPARDRARLAKHLIASLDPEPEEGAEEAWAREIERRVEELRTGKVRTRPAEDVLREIRSKLR